MVSPSSNFDSVSSPSLQSPLSANSTTSEASSSSRSGSTRVNASRHPNLPPPPPADRVPPSRGRSNNLPGHQKFRLRRKGKDKDTYGDVEDDWTLEGGSTNGHGHAPGPSRESMEIIRSPEQTALSDSQLTEVPSNSSHEKKEKKSKGRSLVKKTSRLFSRDKSGEGESSGLVTPGSSASLNPPTSRQASYSSVNSATSHSTTGSSAPGSYGLTHPTSQQSKKLSRAGRGHSRQLSHDSQLSWRPTMKTARSGSSSTYDSPTDIGVPIPPRQGSQMGASVPGLSRHALPQPPPQQSSSAPRNADNFPSRMSSWFSHLIPSNSAATITEDTIASVSAESPSINPVSPLRKPPSAAASFFNAARQRAVDGVRHLLDTEAQPDRCPDTIWVLGVDHPGWRPSTPTQTFAAQPLPDTASGTAEERRGSASSGRPSSPAKTDSGALRPTAWARRKEASSSNPSPISPPNKGFTNLFTASTLSLVSSPAVNGSPSKGGDGGGGGIDSPNKGKRDKKEKDILKWPDAFYEDFRSRVWCTYRGQYAPILSLPNSLLIPTPEAYFSAFGPPADATSDPSQSPTIAASSLQTRPSTTSWSWSRSAEERGLTSDAGWGCMLRTGQSLLANALIHLHLGRDWRLPAEKPSTRPRTCQQVKLIEDYAEYVRILTWFLDDPSPLSPFSVHRMALIGKELGKEVGEWFGPSTAAGALKTLANSFVPCRLTVATATDSVVYKSDVYAASHLPSDGWEDHDNVPRPRRPSAVKYTTWGSKAVLILVGVRLGLENVNSIYYESIKALFTFPQSVGIAGGRPASSYYFVGSQASSLFYLDPHLTRPAVPLEKPPAPSRNAEARGSTEDEAVIVETPLASDRSSPVEVDANVSYTLDVVDVDDAPSDSDSSTSSPSNRIRQARRTSKAAKRLSAPAGSTPPRPRKLTAPSTPSTPHTSQSSQSKGEDPFELTATPTSAATLGRSSSLSSAGASTSENELLHVDPATAWYVNAYPEASLRTFHCEKVKKMPLSSLDPSMLLGFMCKDEADFEDFIERAVQLPQKIFSVQEEPPSWDEDDDPGLESVSEPDLDSPEASIRKRISQSVEDDDDELADESLVSVNTTVEAVDIAPLSRGVEKVDLGQSGTTAREMEEDEEWVGGSTPASQKPVLVEKPIASLTPVVNTTANPPTRQIVPPTSQETVSDPPDLSGEVGADPEPRPDVLGTINRPAPNPPPQVEQGAHSHADAHATMTQGHPLPIRTRTESWVDPGHEWREAPNGDNLL